MWKLESPAPILDALEFKLGLGPLPAQTQVRTVEDEIKEWSSSSSLAADCTVQHQAIDCAPASLREEHFPRVNYPPFLSSDPASLRRNSCPSILHRSSGVRAPVPYKSRTTMPKPSSRLLQGVLRLHRHHHQLHLPRPSPAGAHSSSHFATAAVDPAGAGSGSSPPPSSLPRPFPLSYPPSSAAGTARNSCQSRAFGNLVASEVLPPRAGQAS